VWHCRTLLKNPALESQLGKLFEPMLEAMTGRGPDSAGFAIYGDEVDGWVKLTLQTLTKTLTGKHLQKNYKQNSVQGLTGSKMQRQLC
jgi:glutamate synthase domain-containing protein 1